MRAPTLDEILEVCARASVGESARVDVDPEASPDEPNVLLAHALNILLADLEHRTKEREAVLEARARDKDARYRALFEQALEGICVIGEDERFENVNPEYARILGYEPADLVGRHYSIVVPPDVRESAAGFVRRILAGELILREEHELLRRDGSTVFVEFNGLRGDVGAGRFVKFLIRDITGRLEEERIGAALLGIAQAANQSASEEDLAHRVTQTLSRFIGEGALIGFYLRDDDANVMRLVSGLRYPDELRVVVAEQPVDTDRPAAAVARTRPHLVIEDLVQDPRTRDWIGDICARHAIGSLAGVPILVNGRTRGTLHLATRAGSSLHGADLRLLELAAAEVAHAIARRSMLADLERSESRYRSLYESTNDLIALLDVDGRFIDANPAFLRATGHTLDALRRLRADSVLAAADGAASVLLDETFLKEGALNEEARLVRRDGSTLHVLLNANVQRDAEGRFEHVQATFLDITAIKDAQRDLERALTEIRRAHAAQGDTLHRLRVLNDELEDFTYAVAHDLSEPLRGIETMLAFSLEDAGLSEETRDMLTRARGSAQRLKAMVKGMLELSRIGRRPITRENVKTRDVVQEALDAVEEVIASTNARVDVGHLPKTVHVQRVGFEQILVNLVSNAARYAGPNARVEVSGTDEASHWAFVVRDHGPGVPEAYRERIFQVFSRGPDSHRFEGSGAGLAIAKKIVQQHGGTLAVEDAPGGGALFRFTIVKDYDAPPLWSEATAVQVVGMTAVRERKRDG